MRVVAMISGGKDSCYNMMQCVAEGHEIVGLANLHPKDRDELDSYMYQTVGHMGIEKLAEAMELPLFRMETKGISTQTGKHYVPTDDDEVEDLYNLLKWTKEELNVEAVAVGAIFSDYQRVRVENVCIRLNLVPLAYLWRRDQTELLQEMIDCKVFAIIIKVASLGLLPDRHLGKSISDVQSHLIKMKEKYGLNVCGEGGEYETFTLNCPLFKQKIIIDEMQTVVSSSDPVCPVGYINFTKLRLVPKDMANQMDVVVKTSLDYLSDLNESSYNDLSDPDPDLSESELEQIEMENRLKEVMTKDDLVTSRSNSLTQAATSPIKILQSKTKSCDDVRPLNSPMKIVYEQMDIQNRPNYVFNNSGWMWISGVEGYGKTVQECTDDALEKIRDLLLQHDYKLNHVCYTTLYIRNMAEYVSLNQAYSKTFDFPNPPTRVCVECPLPPNCELIVEVVAFKARTDMSEVSNKRTTMHVQGISHWCPANIGPYSQSTKIGDITYISGQIALVPGSMKIIDGGIKSQCKLILRHINRISKAINAQLRDVVQGICFVTHPNYISEARRQWEKCTTNAIVDYIVCPQLPRQALVEWQVWAHAHNDNFDYEETGCSVGEYTVFSRRRWNYESNCAAIVCYVTTGLASSTTQLTDLNDDTVNRHFRIAQRLSPENIDDILTYTVNKLIKGQQTKTDGDVIVVPMIPSIHLKIYYQVHAVSSVQLLMQSIQEFRDKSTKIVKFAFTLIPACSLQNFSTFLSISGVKHE